jgi:hypothetical protein
VCSKVQLNACVNQKIERLRNLVLQVHEQLFMLGGISFALTAGCALPERGGTAKVAASFCNRNS